jgi:hypothetical protein
LVATDGTVEGAVVERSLELILGTRRVRCLCPTIGRR